MDRESQLTKHRDPHAIAACAPAQTTTVMALFIGSILAVMLFILPAFGQTAGQLVPENASAKSYGNGWECLHGLRRTDEIACVAVELPEGGFFDPSGEQWRCLRGHIKLDDACQEIVRPANAYLADPSFGSTWTCERRFEATGDQCTAIAIPANGYLNGSGYGQPWRCERGFFEQTVLCEAVRSPQMHTSTTQTKAQGGSVIGDPPPLPIHANS